eukprot:2112772-Rhodomonas_salina.1
MSGYGLAQLQYEFRTGTCTGGIQSYTTQNRSRCVHSWGTKRNHVLLPGHTNLADPKCRYLLCPRRATFGRPNLLHPQHCRSLPLSP